MEFTRFSSTTNIKPIRIKVPHSFYHTSSSSSATNDFDFNICLIVKSNEKDQLSSFFENYSPSSTIQSYFSSNNLIPLNYAKQVTVYSVNDIKKYFKEYKNKKELLSNFTHFFVDSEISLYIYNLLGKTFQQHNKYPVALYYSKNLSSLSNSLAKQQALAEGNSSDSSTNKDVSTTAIATTSVNYEKIINEMNKNIYYSPFLFLHSKNIEFKIGFTNMSIQQVQENILYGLFYIMKYKLGNSWKAIKCIYLRTKDSPALPIYSHINYELYEYLQVKLQQKEQSGNGNASTAVVVPASVAAGKKGADAKKTEEPSAVSQTKKGNNKRKQVEEPEPKQEEEEPEVEAVPEVKETKGTKGKKSAVEPSASTKEKAKKQKVNK
jgi:hypothetical protein